MLVPPPSWTSPMIFLIASRRTPTGPSGTLTSASLENVTSEKSSVGARRSTSVRAASRARVIDSPAIDPLTSRTRWTERCGRSAARPAVERSARRTWNGPPLGASLARSKSVRKASAVAVGAFIAGV